MYRILKKQELTTNIYLMDVEAKRVAKSCQPGQFVIVRMDAEGERIPLTICDYDREKGTVTIVFQSVGAETHRMVSLEKGDSFHDFVGPLGCPSELVKMCIRDSSIPFLRNPFYSNTSSLTRSSLPRSSR